MRGKSERQGEGREKGRIGTRIVGREL